MKATRIILAAAAAAVLAAPAFAAGTATESAKAPAMHKWENIDTDHDGFVSKAEWAAEGEKMFDKRDADHDGKISKEEWQHKHAEMRAKRTERRKEWKAAHPSAAAPSAGETVPTSAPAQGTAQ